MKCCDMKGYLSYLILWVLSRKSMTGAEITKELEKRRGKKPSPGTVYPALKELKEKTGKPISQIIEGKFI